MNHDVQPIIDFLLEIDQLKAVARKIQLRGQVRFENSAEHSWQIALAALSLVQHAPEPVDLHRVVSMLLVHDLGEIDTGDTSFFVEGGWEERKAAELAAVRRIVGLLPNERAAHLLALWQEFEAAATAEARFAGAIDRAMPVVLNLANNGQSWRDHGVSHEQVVRRVGPQVEAGCPALWSYLRRKLDAALADGWFGMAVQPAK